MKPEGDAAAEPSSRSRPELPHPEAPAFTLPRNRSRRWRRLEAALWAVAAASACYLAYVGVDRALWSRALNQRLEEAKPLSTRAANAPDAAGEKGGRAAFAVPRTPFEARLEIPSVALAALVVDGVDELTLRRAVGRFPSSARPGESGNVALAGHRDTDFRPLKGIGRGARIELRTADGEYAYEVEWIRIVDPDRVEVLADSPYPTLTLVTCYPFGYIGRAPRRFVVRAREVSRPGLVVAGS